MIRPSTTLLRLAKRSLVLCLLAACAVGTPTVTVPPASPTAVPPATNPPTAASPISTEIPIPEPASATLIYHGVTTHSWSTLWGLTGQADAIQAEVDAYEAAVGRTVAWVGFAHEWQTDGRAFPAEVAISIRNRGATPLIFLNLRSVDVIDEAQQQVESLYTLDAILSGQFDSDFVTWADGAKSFGSELIVDWGWEMNGDWATWNGIHNGGQSEGPQRFQQAYRHIVELMRSRGASNIRWAFHVNFPEYPEEPWNAFENYYPGDDVIDYIGVSIYGTQSPIDESFPSFTSNMDSAYSRLVEMAPQKPVYVFEFGTSANPLGDQAQWADDALADILSGRWPAVRSFAWWNDYWECWCQDGNPAHDTEMRVEKVPGLATVFKSRLGEASNLGDRPPISSPATQDKFVFWQSHSFFRGAAIHPYGPYGQIENRVYMTKEDFEALREQGANVVSLNYPGPYQPDPPYDIEEEALGYLDRAIDWAEEVGLYVIIHFRNGPGKSEETFYSEDGQKDETLWHSEAEQEKWVEMWRFVAERYRDRPHVIGYNLMVEPHPEYLVKQEPLSAGVWFDLAQRIADAIREVDENTPIIVGATAWSNPLAFADLELIDDPHTIYSFHMYEPFEFTHQGFDWAGLGGSPSYEYPGSIPSDIFEEIQYWDRTLLEQVLEPIIQFQTQHQVPILVGEFGSYRKVPSSLAYLEDLLSIFESHGWSYTHYVWRDVTGEFDYERGVDGDERVPESQYMRLFKEHWNLNEYFEVPFSSTTLKDLAADHGIRIGGNYDYELRSETHDTIFEEEFNAMTVGMFWDGVLYQGSSDILFTEPDEMVSRATTLGMEVFGQSLVWFEDIPAWVKSTPLSQVEAVMFKHIDTVVGRYAGRVKLWNVVNEAVDDEGNIRLNHRWAEAMGADYISKAFIRAHAADPTAILYYNEYDIESNEAKFEGVKALLIDLKNQGVPVHALGWQLHVTPGSFDPATLLARMNEIADLGFDNYITELDVELPADASEADYEQQKQTYKTVVETFLAARRHKTIVIWGLRDGSPYWLTNGHPLLFDENFGKKPAYFGVQEALWVP